VPGAAAGLADVGAGDRDPLVGGRVGEHPAQQLAVGGLDLGPLGERDPGAGDPRRQPVAHPLQLSEIEQPRLRRRGLEPVLDLDPPEGLAEQPRQLPLEPPDLPPQLLPRGPLVDPCEGVETASGHKILHRPEAECR
jgi:hypothetical protein